MVHVQLDLESWHGLLEFDVVPAGSVYGFGYVFQDEVEVDFVLLEAVVSRRRLERCLGWTRLVAIRIEE